MFMWSGWGVLVPIIAFCALLMLQLSLDYSLGEGYYQAHNWPKPAAMLLGAFVIGALGLYLNRDKRLRTGDGEEIVLRQQSHRFFFVPMQYWAVVLAIIAVTWAWD